MKKSTETPETGATSSFYSQAFLQLAKTLKDIRDNGEIVKDPLLIEQLEAYKVISKEEADEMRHLRHQELWSELIRLREERAKRQQEEDAKKTPSKTTHE